MHCAITFALLRVDGLDLLSGLDKPRRAMVRAIVVQMILDTDLSKHVQTTSRFRQEFLLSPEERVEQTPMPAGHRKDVLSFLLEVCDVGHSAKQFDLHAQWTLRITCEFFNQGDAEAALGLPCSPFCDRHGTNLAESQRGFFDFVVWPLYRTAHEYLQSCRMELEVLFEVERNNAFWKEYSVPDFDF